ncbi:MAG: tryptophan-rich sensory protein, partial [Cyanobacteria bacterium J06607_6]
MAQVIRQWLTVVAVLMAIAVNGLSNVFPPAGKNTGEVSNTVLGGVMITPAGYAFAIWGLIYLALIAYSIYQALPTQRSSQA